VVIVWVAAVVILGLIGAGFEGKLSAKQIFVAGSQSERAHDLISREFGDQNALFILLQGPTAQVDRQGRQLERRLNELPQTVVVSPWSGGGSIAGLHPSDHQVALLVNAALRPGEAPPDLLPPVERRIDETVAAPVRVSIAGAPVLIDAFSSATTDAVSVAEKIALPVLLIILLLVFRSVIAAAIPVIVGGAVVVATRGVISLLADPGGLEFEAFVLGASGMMGLALGVDYALLTVSRFREELGKTDDVSEAARVTVVATTRSVVPAGCGLLLAMVVAALVVPSGMAQSVSIAISIASVFSVVSAVVVVPAALAILGRRLDRWSLPQRAGGRGAVARWSERLSRRPALVAAIVVFLVVAAGLAFTLQSQIGALQQLPSDNSARLQQEEIQAALGPGWVAPVEVVVKSEDGPVTTPSRLRTLAAFQRKIEADPGVDTMSGLAPIERSTRPLGEFDERLAAQQRGIGRLSRGIARIRDGALAGTDGLNSATDGARKLDWAVGQTHDGAGLIAKGARRASSGSAQLSNGLGRASDGGGKLAEGTAKTSAGASRLSAALAKVAKEAGSSSQSARSLSSAMATGKEALAGVQQPLRASEEQLAAARHALEEMSAGRADPQYGAALAAVNAASRELSGADPTSGEQVDPSYEGVAAGIDEAEGQFGLGNYLSSRIRRNGRKASDGLGKLADGSAKLDHGLSRLAGASSQLSKGLGRLSQGGEQLPPALARLSDGAQHLAAGLGQVQGGAAGLAAGLGSGAVKSRALSGALGKIHDKLERQQDGSSSQLAGSSGLFRSGYFYLAGLDGSKPGQRASAALLINLQHGGSAARMLIIPSSEPTSSAAHRLSNRIRVDATKLARDTGTEVAVGGAPLRVAELNSVLRESALPTRLALCLVTLLVLIPVVRSLTLPLIAALLNLLTLSATFGVLALLFNGSLLGGPGFVDSSVLPATIMVIFGLAIDYEVFLFARMREEYDRTGSTKAAISNGLVSTAPVISGAALIMIAVFVTFAVSAVPTLRNFGVAQALAVFIDAFVVRLVLLPGLMRILGERAWWCPAWLDRVLPGDGRVPAAVADPVEATG
jgi:RND superfamily putative drug exporter